MQLDAMDLRILAELQQDSSLTNVELSKRVHLSPSPCLTRVKALEAGGVIDRYVALANPKALGLGRVHVFLDVVAGALVGALFAWLSLRGSSSAPVTATGASAG